MNSLASSKCATRVLVALAAIAGIVLTAGCGSGSGFAKTNPVGFSNSSLSGTYVVSVSGTDITATTFSFFAITGTVMADGAGHILQGGTVDINDADLGGVFTGQTLSASTYSVSQDGRGTGNLVTPQGTFVIDFVLTSSSHGLITRFDNNGTGSGTIDLQGSASQGSLTSLAFSVSGSDAAGNPLGSVGEFTLNSSGTIVPAGIEDSNDNGTSVSGLTGAPLTGSLVLSSGTSGTAQLNSSLGALLFDVWVIDSTHLKLIETDASGLALSGDAFTQQTSFPAGQLVFTLAGLDSSLNPVVAGGFVTAAANGTLSNGTEDYNDSTTGTAATVPGVGGSCTTFTAGRCELALTTGFSNGGLTNNNFKFAAYPSSGGIQLLEIDGLGILQGTAYAQTATAFNTTGSYGLNLTGVNFDGVGDSGEIDDIAQFNVTSAATNNIPSGVVDENSLLGGPTTSPLTGTYTADSPATGRGSILITANKTFIGGLSLEYYVVDASTVLIIEADADQFSVGTFQMQSASAGATAVQSRVFARAPGRTHGALRHK